jgi:hypothetical protein
LVVSSCKEPDEYPIQPIINYKSIHSVQNANGLDQKIVLLINFTDGDGDVGYKEVGQNGPEYDVPGTQYYNNYVAKLFKFKNNVWDSVPTITPLGGRIPYLTPEGKNKALKGEIQCDVLLAGLGAEQDTYRVELFIYDRGFHQSNTVTTDNIVLTTQ